MPIIHLQWHSPVAFEAVEALTSDADYGLYAIYGTHPCYGTNALIYVGRSGNESVGRAISKESMVYGDLAQADLRYGIGRLTSPGAPPRQAAVRSLLRAHELLVAAHSPAFNSPILLTADEFVDDDVLNWGERRDLLPEVSAARWTEDLHLRENFIVHGEPT